VPGEIRRRHRQSGLPRPARRPAVAHYRGQGVCFLEAMQPEFVEYQKQVVATPRCWRRPGRDGFRVVSGGKRIPICCWWMSSPRASGAGSGEGARRSFYHGQQEHHPVRRQSAAQPRASGWAARRYHSRFGEDEMAESPRLMRRSACATSPPGNARLGTQPRRGPHPEVPAVRLEMK